MISKETLHRFLLALDSQYYSSVEYFSVNPYSEIQHKVAELQTLLDEHEMCVCWKSGSPHGVETYDISYMFDIRDRLASVRSPVNLQLGVYSVSDVPSVSLTPDSELFQKMAKLFVETDGHQLYMPTDVITIDDMSFTVHDILCAINEHSEPHRLKYHMVVDRYVTVNYEGFIISSSERFSDEMIDKIEKVVFKVIPYWDGTKKYEYEDRDDYVQWDSIMKGEMPVLTENNVIYLCCNKPNKDELRGNIESLTNIVNFICDTEDKFVGIMLIRALTHASINITYKDVPRFKEYVAENGLYLRQIRRLL